MKKATHKLVLYSKPGDLWDWELHQLGVAPPFSSLANKGSFASTDPTVAKKRCMAESHCNSDDNFKTRRWEWNNKELAYIRYNGEIQ